MAKEDLIFLLAKVVRYLGACKSCEENQDDHIEAIEDMIQENWRLDDARTRLSKMVSEHEYCQTSCVRETAILGSITSNHFGIELRDYSILEKLRASESRRKGESETRLPPNDQPQGKKFRKQEVKS